MSQPTGTGDVPMRYAQCGHRHPWGVACSITADPIYIKAFVKTVHEIEPEIEAAIIAAYLASPEAEKALAEALGEAYSEQGPTGTWDEYATDFAAAILAAWRKLLP